MPRLKVELRGLVRTDRQLRALGLRGTAVQQQGPRLVCHPCRVATTNPGEDGFAVAVDGCLVAVLVRVEAGSSAGRDEEGPVGWYLEAGFGPCQVATPPLFDTLGEALAWVRQQYLHAP